MQTAKYMYWEEDGGFIGYFLDYPDYWTQGATLDNLKEHLRDLYDDLTSGDVLRRNQKVSRRGAEFAEMWRRIKDHYLCRTGFQYCFFLRVLCASA